MGVVKTLQCRYFPLTALKRWEDWCRWSRGFGFFCFTACRRQAQVKIEKKNMEMNMLKMLALP